METRIDQLELRIDQLLDLMSSLQTDMKELRQILAIVVGQQSNSVYYTRVDDIDDFKLEAAIIAAAKQGEGPKNHPYQCSRCGRRYVTPYSLSNHNHNEPDCKPGPRSRRKVEGNGTTNP